MVFVHFLPDQIPSGSLSGGVAVVIDVLRASTVMVRALASGCESIRPCAEIEQAQAMASTFPSGSVLLAGERTGLPIPGFDLGNSPGDFSPERCRGRTLIMTTTNGTRAILACLDADEVLVASWQNLGATIRRLRDDRRPIHFVCAGTDGLISFEDSELAAAMLRETIADPLSDPPSDQSPYPADRLGNDGALLAWAIASHESAARRAGTFDLMDAMTLGRGGRRVRQIGLEADIREAATVDRFDLVAELRRDPLRIVAAGSSQPGRDSLK